MLPLLLLCLTALAGPRETIQLAENGYHRAPERKALYQQAVEEADALLAEAPTPEERANALTQAIWVRLHVARGGKPWQVVFEYHPLPPIWQAAYGTWAEALPELSRQGLVDAVALELMDQAAVYGAGTFEAGVAHDCLHHCVGVDTRGRASQALHRRESLVADAEAHALRVQERYRSQWTARNRDVRAIQAQQAENDLFQRLRHFSGPERNRIIAPIRHTFAVDQARSEMRRRGTDAWWGAHEDLTREADPRWWWITTTNEKQRLRLARSIRYRPWLLLGLGGRAGSEGVAPVAVARVGSGPFHVEAEAAPGDWRLRGGLAVVGKPVWYWKRPQLGPSAGLALRPEGLAPVLSIDASFTYRSKGFAVMWNVTVAPEVVLAEELEWGLRITLASGTPFRPKH